MLVTKCVGIMKPPDENNYEFWGTYLYAEFNINSFDQGGKEFRTKKQDSTSGRISKIGIFQIDQYRPVDHK